MSIQTSIVSIEGNIGAGKSVLLAKLRQRFEQRDDVIFVEEPIDEWLQMRDAEGASILQRYYEDPAKHAFSFQMLACISRLKRLRRALASGARYIICERSLATDRHVFAELLHASGQLTSWEFKIYTDWYTMFSADLPATRHLYLAVDSATCEERIATRGRKGEKVDPTYLTKCGQAHDVWMDSISKDALLATVDAEVGPTEVLERCVAALGTLGLRPSPTTAGTAAGWVLQFDGAARGNPGPAGWGYWASYNGRQVLADCGRLPTSATNNEAEYEAALSGLRALSDYLETEDAPGDIVVRGDSLLVVNQLNGIWACRATNLQGRYASARETLRRLRTGAGSGRRVSIEHVPREQNTRADTLANEGVDGVVLEATSLQSSISTESEDVPARTLARE